MNFTRRWSARRNTKHEAERGLVMSRLNKLFVEGLERRVVLDGGSAGAMMMDTTLDGSIDSGAVAGDVAAEDGADGAAGDVSASADASADAAAARVNGSVDDNV